VYSEINAKEGKMTELRETQLKTLIILLAVFGPFAGWVHYGETRMDYVCHEKATVVEIVEISYRDGKALMSNGEFKEFGQRKTPVRVGNEYCMRGALERNDLPEPWYMFWK
jgi:hypothetical protein